MQNLVRSTCISYKQNIYFFTALPDRDEEGNNINDEFSELPFPRQVNKTCWKDLSIGDFGNWQGMAFLVVMSV